MNNFPDDMNQAQFEAYWGEIRPYLHESDAKSAIHKAEGIKRVEGQS